MVGKIGGVLLAAALVGGLFAVAPQPHAAAQTGSEAVATSGCGPVTLDQLFPGLDPDGNPVSTTTTTPAATTTTTAIPSSTSTLPGETTTTVSQTTTTGPETTTTTGNPPPPCRTWVYEMVFPIATDARVISDFGDDRDGGSRRHKGTDLVADRMAPVVAVADGVVSSVHNTPAVDCCYLTIRHDDGWSSLYVHLNNDDYPGDNGLGIGVAPGLEVGTAVTAGQVIGWVGDSGNAEGTIPHLHFELRAPQGYSVDPVPSVRAAKSKAELSTQRGVYNDDDGMGVESTATRLVAVGGYWPCVDDPLALCPNRLAQPEETADLIGRLMGMPPVLADTVQQTLAFQKHLPPGTLELVTGCEIVRDCLQSGITGADVARMISWVYDAQRKLANDPETDLITDLALHSASVAESNLRFRGIIEICHPSLDTDRLVTRADVIDLVTWWIQRENPLVCNQSVGPNS